MFFGIILIIALLYFYQTGDLQRMSGKIQNNNDSQNNDPMNILKVRLAKGEITEEEYNKIKEQL